MDLTGPHVCSKNGHKYLLTGICNFTKYLVAVPLRDKSALSVARALVRNVYLVYGAVELQITDQGREFCNEVMSNIAKMLGIQLSTTTAYRPSSNGVCERVHATLHSVFAKTVEENQRDWCELVPYVTFAYNISYHASTTHSPFYLMFLREPRTGVDLLLETSSERFGTNLDDFTEEMEKRMKIAYALVADQLGVSFSRAKARYDRRVREIHFSAGDFVWYYCPRRRPRRNRKWQLMTDGPYLIRRKVNLVNYVIQAKPGGRIFIAHVDKLKPYEAKLSAAHERWRAEACRPEVALGPEAGVRFQEDAAERSGQDDGPTSYVTSETPVAAASDFSRLGAGLAGCEPSRPAPDFSRSGAGLAGLAGCGLDAVSDRHSLRDQQKATHACESDIINRPRRVIRKPARFCTLAVKRAVKDSKYFLKMSSGGVMCEMCGMRYQADTGIRRHMISHHQRRYVRGGPSQPLFGEELAVAQARVRKQQANSSQRRAMKAEAASAVASSGQLGTSSNSACRAIFVGEAGATDAGQAMEEWPEGLDFPELGTSEVRKVYLRDVAASTDSVSRADASQNVGVLVGQGGYQVLPAGITHRDIMEVVRAHTDYSPRSVVGDLVRSRGLQLDRLDSAVLLGHVTSVIAGRQELARELLELSFRLVQDPSSSARDKADAVRVRLEGEAHRTGGPDMWPGGVLPTQALEERDLGFQNEPELR